MAEKKSPIYQFRQTRWSIVLRARGEGSEARRALEDLCQCYWFPIYALCRRHGLSPADAEDMVQSFFVKIIEKRFFDTADASRGKLRSFLHKILQRHIKDEKEKATTQRRGGGRVVSFNAVEAEDWYVNEQIEGETPDHLYDRQWALTVLGNALGELRKQAVANGRTATFDAMRPFLTNEGNAESYEEAASPLGMKADTFKVGIHRLRGKFRDALRAQVAETQLDGTSIDEEIAYLMKMLRGI